MPELPEITNYRNYADEALLDKRILKVEFGDSKPLQESQKAFRDVF